MQDLEPYYNWRHLYTAEEDPESPFFGREYSEFEYSNTIYNFYIHPQWDDMGSPTLYIKILFCDYTEGAAIVEMIGEWNDCLHNDIMILKRDIADHLMAHGIRKFILIGENVLNFHFSDDCYYEEWLDDVEEGWIVFMNFREHVLKEFQQRNLDYYFISGGQLDEMPWRTMTPQQLIERTDAIVRKRLE
ncbi:MAG: hypothetical protein ACHQRM_09950 [Bacteroidia bacterium]